MRRTLFVIMALVMSFQSFAQNDDLYLIFEFMHVDEESYNNYWQVEEQWAKLHQARANAGEIYGWDLWSLEPSGQEQFAQFMTVTLFDSWEAMMARDFDWEANIEAAFPDMTEEQWTEAMALTSSSRTLTHRLFMHEIDRTSGDFDMPIGTVGSIDWMYAKSDDYESIESELFKPWHQEMVDNGEKGYWGLLRVVLPFGTDRYATHCTVNMYENIGQMAAAMSSMEDADMMTEMAVEEGLSSREMKSVHLARLEMKVRPE